MLEILWRVQFYTKVTIRKLTSLSNKTLLKFNLQALSLNIVFTHLGKDCVPEKCNSENPTTKLLQKFYPIVIDEGIYFQLHVVYFKTNFTIGFGTQSSGLSFRLHEHGCAVNCVWNCYELLWVPPRLQTLHQILSVRKKIFFQWWKRNSAWFLIIQDFNLFWMSCKIVKF